jgi:hypothetical protein
MATTMPVARPERDHPRRVDLFRPADNESTGREAPRSVRRKKDFDFERTVGPSIEVRLFDDVSKSYGLDLISSDAQGNGVLGLEYRRRR